MSQVPVPLARLEVPSKTVVRSLHGDCLDEILTNALEELGVVIIRELPAFLSQHPVMTNHFVHAPLPQSVLKALTACPSEKKIGMCSLTCESKRSIRNFLSKVSSVEPLEKGLLSRLPLFETLNKSFVSKESGLRAAPEGPLPVMSHRDFIDITQEDSKRLARLLGIVIPTMTAFLFQEVFPDVRGGKYSGEEVDVLMAFVMERYQVYAASDSRIGEEMKSLPFVPTLAGRVRPTEVFDPRNERLRCIFADEDVFPVGTQYTDPAILVVLDRLGLKSEDKIDAQDLYQSANKIAGMSDILTAEKKSEAIKAHLLKHPMRLLGTVEGAALGSLLQDVPWVSVLKEKPHGFPRSLHFWVATAENTQFCRPTEVENKDNVNLIGSVKPIVEVNSSSPLAKCFRWDEMPSVWDVVKQLRAVTACYNLDEKPLYISVVKDIYSYLSRAANTSAVEDALQGIQNLRWIWNGDGFSSPKAVLAQKPSVDLSPYISHLPVEVTSFSNFFSRYGMQEHCDAPFLLHVLHLMKQKYDDGCSFDALEVKRDLQLSVDILNEIKPSSGEKLSAELQEKVLIPTRVNEDSCVKLAPIKDCVYCESEWMETDDHDEEINALYVHPNIAKSTAQLLGVPPSKYRMLDPDEMNIGDEFGQEEKLTRRLNRLLEDYTDGFAVPKELIQNADDAGATEVRFLYDERTNEDAKIRLFDEKMSECQGPALWVYNDAVFQDEDFANIKQLNGGTKELHTEKIGKFGLGFNAVYNLTDVPMFLSRQYFVIFDPNNFYLENAFGNKTPGVRLDINKKRNGLRKYSGQFKPFNGIFGCDLHLDKDDNSFEGTLFRFPLRTKEQAVRSEIKQVYYDDKQVRDLLEIFISGARTLLLFTQNVRRVSIFHLSNSADVTQPALIFEVNKSLSQAGIIRELPFPVTLSSKVEKLNEDGQYFLKQCNFLRASSEVAKGRGRAYLSETELLRSALTIDVKTTVTECGNTFFGDKDNLRSSSETWLLASSIGRGQAVQFSEADKALLPSAGVAVQLIPYRRGEYVPAPVFDQVTGRTTRHNGTVFCYLPLPIHSGLPVHINGAFAVASNRRHLKEKTEDDKACIGVQWNDVLLRDSVCAAYLDLLEDLKSAAGMYSFHLLWPMACCVEPNCEALARSFYQQVTNGSCSLFSDSNRWVDINQVVFLEPNFRHEEHIGDISFKVFKMLIQGNVAVIDLPTDAFQSFVKYGLAEKIKSKLYGKDRFFRELFFPNMALVPPDLRNKLTLYALDEGDGKFDELLKTYPCIPATPSGQKLKCPHQLVNPFKDAASLFREEDERFPFGTETFLNTLRLAKLEQLGMMANDPPWNVFAERAESVNILNQENSGAALKRTTSLLHLLAKKLNNEGKSSFPRFPEGIQERILQAKFLPVAAKPKNFPLSWRGDDLRRENQKILISPKEAFPEAAKYLVCCSEAIVDIYIPFVVGRFLLLDRERVTTRHVVTQLHSASSTNIQSLDYLGFEEVKQVCLAAYGFLQTILNDRKVDEKQLKEMLHGKKVILIAREFVDGNHVAFELNVDCSPYLHVLSSDLSGRFHSLMKILGVRQAFERKDFVTSLKKIKCKFGETALDEKNTQVAVHLISQLAKSCIGYPEDDSNTQERKEEIYLPDSKGVMRLAGDLCLKDCYWLPDDFDVYYVNEMILPTTSITLGVKTRREEALRRFAVGISFGQKEKLTNRLHRLLSAYPCEKEILKELLQNADDAEATEICFIKDPRQHSDVRVFEESWKPLQGPALCVYNNKPFTEADIEGIQNLGEGSKGDDPNKTGQYGVGFNAVYHLTDVPSFTSSGEEIGDVLCVFDPLCQYVPGATQQAPGRMFKESKKLREIFPDVFSCYAEEHFPMQNSTMFRFPLRTQEMAKSSEISKSVVTLESLETMMKELKGELFEALLFVNNVRKIMLCDIDESGEVANSYSVMVLMSEEDSVKRQEFAAYVKQTGKSGKQASGGVLPINAEVRKCSYVLKLKDSNGYEEEWLIVQQIGFENKVETSIVDAYRKQDLGMLPRGGVACLLQNNQRNEELLKRKKKAYCFLPLPIETNLPVHVNGHFALDHEARRNLWPSKSDDYRSDWNNALITDVITSCYLALLGEVRNFHQLPVTQNVDQATLSCSKDDFRRRIDDYEKRFPSVVSSNPYWMTLVTSVYQEMNRSRLRLLPVLREDVSENVRSNIQVNWLPPTGEGKDKAFFNNLEVDGCFKVNLESSDDKERKKEKERNSFEFILLKTGFNLVAFSLSVYTAVTTSGVNPCCVTPSAVMEFYKSFNSKAPLCKIGRISVDVKETPFESFQGVEIVLRYCKGDKEFLANLSGLPLLLTQDNYLHTFSAQDPKFLSRHHIVLPECKEMFVHIHTRTHIFSDPQSSKVPVFKHFDISSFAANLHRTLSLDYISSEGYVKWHPEQDRIPNRDWIQKVWKFLCDETNSVIRASEAEKMNRFQAETSKDNAFRSVLEARLTEDQKTRIIRETLEPLKNTSLLPCTETFHLPQSTHGSSSGVATQHFLVPFVLAETVIDLTSSDGTRPLLVEALRALALPELNKAVLATSSYPADSCNLACKLVASLKTPASLLTSLKQKMEANPESLEGKLLSPGCDTVLQYFSDNDESLEERDKSTLRRLPFYEATHGGRVGLNDYKVCVVLTGIPRDGMNHVENRVDVVFLKSRERLSPLFNFLAFESLSAIDVYCKFILKNFCCLPKEARLAHLEHIRDWILPLQCRDKNKRKRLLNCLASTEILPSGDGTLKKASCYYDPHNKVFKTMLSESSFPPEPFKSPEWLEFLKSIGLICEVSHDHFLSFASDLAREGATMRSKSTDEKSKVLVDHLFSREDVVQESLLQAVCHIRFVAPEPVWPELQEIHCQFGDRGNGQLQYISFRGSVLAKHAKTVWTTAPLLPQWANPWKCRHTLSAPGYCNSILAHLQVLIEPTVDLVTSHCQNVCFQMEKQSESDLLVEQLLTRTSVMSNIYRFLQAKGLSSEVTKQRLKDTPCILVEKGRRFVKAAQVVLELYKDCEIKPFLYRMPAELGEFKELFQYLGCSPSVKSFHYAMVLELLQKRCKTNRLDPNETDRSLRAVKGFFEALQNNPNDHQRLSSLYLPAICLFGKSLENAPLPVILKKADSLLFDDAPHYHHRIETFPELFVVDLRMANVRCNLSANHKDLVLQIPKALQPRMLSSVVEETFAEPRDNIQSFDVGTAMSLQTQLRSDQFCRGVIRLIHHASHENQKRVDEHVVASVKSHLRSIQFHGMSKIITRLVYEGKTISGSESEVPYFVEKICHSDTEIWNVYVNAAEGAEETMSAIALTLSQVIAVTCQGLLRETAMYIPEMLRSPPEKISSLLDRMKVRQDDSWDAAGGQVLPLPGSFIPIAEHHLLNPDLNAFEPGEYVGYELEDPSLDFEEGEATFIYAVIIDEIPNGHTSFLLKSYKINIGHDTEMKIVQATDLYKFYRLQEIVSTAITPSDQQGNSESVMAKQAVLDDISRTLEEAWRLPEDRKRNVIKRLMLQWHPDRNPGNEVFCTDVFKHIINEIERLEKEGPGRSEKGSPESYCHRGSYGDFFSFFGASAGARARRYTSQRHEYRDNYYRHYGSWGHGTRTWDVPPSFCTRNPQPREARRWLRQADADLAAVRNDIKTAHPSFEWACFKCHQVCKPYYAENFFSSRATLHPSE